MADLNSIDYYRSREKNALALADAATSPAIAAIYLEMAATYALIIRQSFQTNNMMRSSRARAG